MDVPTTIAVIRDLVIVIAGLLVIVFLLVGSIFTWRILRSIKRTVRNVEQTSSTLLEIVNQSPSYWGILKNLVSRGVGFINRDQS